VYIYTYGLVGEIPYDKEEKIMGKSQHNALYWTNPIHHRRKNNEKKPTQYIILEKSCL